MLISGGYNVYPREVEDVLLACEGVVEAAVVGLARREMGRPDPCGRLRPAGPRRRARSWRTRAKSSPATSARRASRSGPSLPKSSANKILRRAVRDRLLARMKDAGPRSRGGRCRSERDASRHARAGDQETRQRRRRRRRSRSRSRGRARDAGASSSRPSAPSKRKGRYMLAPRRADAARRRLCALSTRTSAPIPLSRRAMPGFERLNPTLKQLITDWQTIPGARRARCPTITATRITTLRSSTGSAICTSAPRP